jgi:hypothetical protein
MLSDPHLEPYPDPSLAFFEIDVFLRDLVPYGNVHGNV